MKMRRRRLSARVMVLAALSAAFVLQGTPPASAGRQQETPTTAAPTQELAPAGWSVQPTGDNGVTPRDWFEYQVRPGQTVRDMVTVNNLTDAPLEIAIYPTDAYNTPDGGFAFSLKDEDNVEAGEWVTLGYETVTVPAKQRADLVFEIKVPADAAPGDHAAGIVTELVNPPKPADDSGQGVVIQRRLAARMYLRVEGARHPALEVTALGVVRDEPLLPPFSSSGTATIGYQVTNTGNTRIQGQAEVKLKGLFGREIESWDAVNLPELLPGASIVLTQEVDKLPRADRVEAVVKVTAPDVESTRSKVLWTVSWLELAIVVGLILFVYGISRARRRRRRGPATPPPVEVKETVGV